MSSLLKNHQPDFEQFLKVVRREGKPTHIPFYEHITTLNFISRTVGMEPAQIQADKDTFWKTYVEFWMTLGFDCVPLESPLLCKRRPGAAGLTHGSEAGAIITNRQEFDEYEWPSESAPIDFTPFEMVAKYLPEGAKIVGGVGAGPYEWASRLMGVMGLSYALLDDPELVGMIFDRLGKLFASADRQLAQMDCIGALRQGDDLGFKTSTFLRPEHLRQYVFPIYKQQTAAAHEQGKPFVLHSCGNLAEVYDDIIGCGVDAKHSFEDAIMPVADFKKEYGTRITPLGGLDVDVICRSSKEDLRKYARKHIEDCFHDGYWTMGTGNSLTDYMPVENYLVVLEEARRYS